jgi:hypothetical protein
VQGGPRTFVGFCCVCVLHWPPRNERCTKAC